MTRARAADAVRAAGGAEGREIFPTRRARKAKSRARVLEAARGLAEVGGITRLTMDEVGRRASLSKAAVIFHFRSKNGLLAELLREDATTIAAELHEATRAALVRGAAPKTFETVTRGVRRTMRGTGLAEALRQALAGTERERADWKPLRQLLMTRLLALARACGLGMKSTLAASLVLLCVAFGEEIPALARLSILAATGIASPGA